MKWTGSVSGQDEEHGHSGHRDQIQREQDNKLDNLPKGEGRVDSTRCRFAEFLDRICAIGMEDPLSSDELFVAFIQEDSVEDIDQGLVHEECFEERANQSRPFA